LRLKQAFAGIVGEPGTAKSVSLGVGMPEGVAEVEMNAFVYFTAVGIARKKSRLGLE